MNILIKNCRLISPDLELSDASIAIEGKSVKKIYSKKERLPELDFTYDAEGKMAVPGFVDMHFHGNRGFDITDGTLEALKSIAEFKLYEGVTTIIPTTLTVSKDCLVKVMNAVAAYQQETPYAKIAGIHLEGPFINPNCLGAQNPDFVRSPDIKEVAKLNNIAKISLVSFAIEAEGGIKFIKDLIDLGIVPSCGHSAATYEEYKKAKKTGLKHLTHFCNQMTKLHHREIGLVGAGLLDDDILLEIICDKIHLCPEMIKLIFKVKNIENIALITDAIAASWLDDGCFNLGGLEVEVKNGEARLSSSGALAGSTLRFYDALKNVYEITGLPLKQLIKTTAFNQAKSLGLEMIGKIEPGYFADIVILDNKFRPATVFVNGKPHECIRDK